MKSHPLSTAVLLCAVLAAGCESPAGPAQSLPVTRITSGFFSSVTTPQRLVLRSEREFADAWTALFRNQSPPPAPPAVDFSTDMVILAHAGEKPTSTYCISIESASGNRRRATVTVLSVSPPPVNALLPTLTQPFDVVRLPRRDEVSFQERSENRQCGIMTVQ